MAKISSVLASLFVVLCSPVSAQQFGFSAPLAGDTRAAYGSPNSGSQQLSSTYFEITRQGSMSEPIIALRKISNSTTNAQNPTAIFIADKWTTAGGTRVQGGFSEATDFVGWDGTASNNFVEGWRTHGIIAAGAAGGSAYGLVSFAGAVPSVAWKFLIGAEGEVANNTADAPSALLFDRDHFSSSFVATSSGSHIADAGYMTNGYSASPFRTGFLVTKGSVVSNAFVSAASTDTGVDLSLGSQTWAAIAFNKNTPIRIEGKNVLYADTSNNLVLGAESSGIYINIGGIVKPVTQGSPDSCGIGFACLRVPN